MDPIELGGVPLSLLRELRGRIGTTRELLQTALVQADARVGLLDELIVEAERRESEAVAAFVGAPARPATESAPVASAGGADGGASAPPSSPLHLVEE